MARNYEKYLNKVLYPILMICGPSGVGKSTLVKLLASINGIYELSVSYTTRELTEEERKTKLYRRVTKARFQKMIAKGLFAEYNHYKGNDCYYGTPWSEFNRIFKAGKVPALDIDINGLVSLDKKLSRLHTYRLYLDVGPEEQEKRIVVRARPTDTPEKIQSRIKTGIKEKELLLRYSAEDPTLFNEIKDYNKVDPSLYANHLINVLAVYMKAA